MNTKAIWTDPDRCGGRPCLRGHRITVSQLLQEISEVESIRAVCKSYDLPYELLLDMLTDLAIYFDYDGDYGKDKPNETIE